MILLPSFHFSDIKIQIENEEVFAHKFVLAARSQIWRQGLDQTDKIGKISFISKKRIGVIVLNTNTCDFLC